VYFEVLLPSFVQKNFASRQRSIPSPPHIHKESFVTNISRALRLLSRPPNLVSTSAIDDHIAQVSSAIISSTLASKRVPPRSPSAKNMPWWTEELRALRSKTRTHLKAWSRSKSEQTERLYRRSKNKFQRALRAAKSQAWAEFRTKATTGDTFKALASFTGKRNSISLPPALSVNGALTSDPATIAAACARHFFHQNRRPTNRIIT
jgi:hypothetical protein